jgi:TRAP-type C4-dicarboxylate transport system permease small subunit
MSEAVDRLGAPLFRKIESAVAAVEHLASLIAACVLCGVMLIVAADVAMRYIFNRPFGWTYDLISLYLMGALFYFALSPTFAQGAHISVDVIAHRLPTYLRRALQIVIALVSAALFATIAWLAAARTLDDFQSGAATSGEILWPTWLADVLVPLGCALLTLRLIVHAVGHLLSLATGQDLVPLAAPPGADETGAVVFE